MHPSYESTTKCGLLNAQDASDANLNKVMKNYFILFFLFILYTACDKKGKAEKVIEEIPLEITVERFDKLFYETPAENLGSVKQRYPYFFPGSDDNVWLNKMKDPLWREVYTEVQRKYPDFGNQEKDAEELFRHIKYYFPKTKTPKLITLISEMDYNAKSIYADSLVLISLELYLGKDHKFYDPFPAYLRQNFEARQIMPDIATSFSQTKIKPADNMLLSQMVYYGKELYLKDLLLPDYSDAEKIGYNPEQIAWCQENESYVWRYMIESKLLYETDLKLAGRFITPAPFSKFYLEIDNDSPGRVGQWIGWQVVRSYMKNNDVPLDTMLKMNSRELFEKSKYKPKKVAE